MESTALLLSGEDEDEEEMELDASETLVSVDSRNVTSISLLQNIISPSPFAHHNDPATTDRYRSALQRIQVSPQSDVEAWQAIMNECLALYRSHVLPSMEEERQGYRHSLRILKQQRQDVAAPTLRWSEALESQLDWIESCHGHLLQIFPYASNYYVSVLEILMARTAHLYESLTGADSNLNEEDLTLATNSGSSKSIAREMCELKIQDLFQRTLGLSDDDTSKPDTFQDETFIYGSSRKTNSVLGGMCVSSIELWLLYVRKKTRDAQRFALEHHLADSSKPPSLSNLSTAGEEYIRNTITNAYELALKNGAAFSVNNHVIWRHYVNFVKAWNVVQMKDSLSHVDQSLLQKQRQALRTIYQRIITIPMVGLDTFWIEYESFEKTHSEQLAAVLIAEHLPKFQHARSVQLERNRLVNVVELRIGRLATPPADLEFAPKIHGVSVNTASMSEKWSLNSDEYQLKMKEECVVLAKWQKRIAYERTNPERLSAIESSERIRLLYKDFVTCFMRHIEVWHEWSTWELLQASGVTATTSSSTCKSRSVQNSLTVLAMAQHHLPDSTLLAYLEANVLEANVTGLRTLGPKDEDSSIDHPSIQALTKFCNRNPTTLGFVLLQRLVRKYQGKQQARAIFARARRSLQTRTEDMIDVPTEDHLENKGGEDALQSASTDELRHRFGAMSGSGRMVMNRERSIHSNGEIQKYSSTSELEQSNLRETGKGVLTWHLYASHALMEHRLNGSPHIAARIFELGLRKHRTFLSTPQYVLQYAALLLELKDEDNFRALLARSISACEEDLNGDQDVSQSGLASHSKRAAQKPLWDLMLKFESVLTNGDTATVQSLEARRRRALYGPQQEDIAGIDWASFGADGDVGIGAQRSNLGEMLIRSEGYDVCSRVSNGMHRLVDSLETAGLWVDGYSLQSQPFENPSNLLWRGDDGSSGMSDASFRRRMVFKEHYRLFSALSGYGESGTGGSSGKLLSVKERLAHGTSQNPTALLITQAVPEWIRSLLLLLPLNARLLRGAKAPPHLIEITLAALRDSMLPSERPADDKNQNGTWNASGSRKRLSGKSEDDSSDEEGESAQGGYSDQFRARQRARMMDIETSNS